MKNTALSGLAIPLLFLAGCAAPKPNDTAPDAQLSKTDNADLQKARELIGKKLYYDALRELDGVLKKHPDSRQAHELAAQSHLLILTEKSPQWPQTFANDALSHLRAVVKQYPGDGDAYMKLAEAYYTVYAFNYLDPKWELARDTALTARNTYRGQKAGTEKVAQAQLLTARCDLRLFIAARRPEIQKGEKTPGKSATEATVVLSRLARAKQMGTEETRGAAYVTTSLVYEWMNQRLQALHELERGLQVAPNYQPLHDKFLKMYEDMERQEVAASVYRGMIRDYGEKPGLLTGFGEAKTRVGDKLRKQRKFSEAENAYKEALEVFEKLQGSRGAAWVEFYKEYRAILLLTLAAMNVEAGEFELAKASAFAAYSATPRVLDTNEDGAAVVVDRAGTDFYLGILDKIGNAIAKPQTPEALRATLDFWDIVIAKHPKKFGWMYNNAALAARDLGTQVEARGRRSEGPAREKATKEAMALWEKSYGLYSVGAELSPDDPRIVNDCGLMLVYHLKRDYDRALKLFQQAIEIGKKQLQEMPEDTDRQTRENLEEAVGDAYQNTAVLLQNQGKPFKDYEEYCKEAVKYFPYQQRQAARVLRFGQGRGRATEATAKPKPDPRIAEFQKVAAEAKKKAEAEDFDGALLVLDKVQTRMQGHAPFHYLAGLYSLQYATQVRAKNGNGRQIDGLYADARLQLQKSVEVDGEPCEPRLYLIKANYDSGELINAAKICDALLSHLASRGVADKSLHAEALKLRAQSGTRIYLAARRANKDDQPQLTAARSSFRALEQMNALDLTLMNEWAELERSAGQAAAAVQIFVRAVKKQPNNQPLLGALVDQAARSKQSTLAIQTLQQRKDAVGMWYLGKARSGLGQELLNKGKNAEGMASFDKAIADFRQSMQADKNFTYSCMAWIAICKGCKGYELVKTGDYASAERVLLEAAKDRPDRASAMFAANQSVRLGLFLIVDHYAKTKNLGASENILRKAGTILPNDGGIANDHGLFARDHGVALEAAGKKKAAMAMYEAAFASYQRASKLEPENLRLANDLALMQIYHLKRNLRAAKESLVNTAKAGRARLANDPPTEDDELQDLKETIGDCYQNLGYCQMVHDKDHKAARKNFEESLKWYPFKERSSVQHLKRLDRLQGARK